MVEGHDREDISVMMEEQYGNNPVWQSLDVVSEGELYTALSAGFQSFHRIIILFL